MLTPDQRKELVARARQRAAHQTGLTAELRMELLRRARNLELAARIPDRPLSEVMAEWRAAKAAWAEVEVLFGWRK